MEPHETAELQRKVIKVLSTPLFDGVSASAAPKYEHKNYQAYRPMGEFGETHCIRIWLNGFPESGVRQDHYSMVRSKLPGFELTMHNVIAAERGDPIAKPKMRFAIEGSLDAARKLAEPSGKNFENFLIASACIMLIVIVLAALANMFDLDGLIDRYNVL